jgi:uncharacterized protein (TIGR02145 family)
MKKKTSILIYPLLAIGFLLILINGCKKDDDKSTVTDIDGNVYHTVTIGTQTWMVENLKVTRYRNGDTIPNVTDGTEWSSLTTGACCDYENTASNGAVYGKLYNWYSVSDSRNIAPTGWHVPSDAEWTTLTTFLGGEAVAGGKLKERWTPHWKSPNKGATNETGFTALSGGYRAGGGSFEHLRSHGYWWSSSQYDAAGAWNRFLHYDNAHVGHSGDYNSTGFSVRCLQD